MKKFLSVTVAGVLAVTLLAGCGGNDDNKHENNQAPVFTGVSETIDWIGGDEWDALAGVTATDAEDGDLTSKIKVSCADDELTFENGKTTPDGMMTYYITYSVTDSDGETTEAYCTLNTTEAAEPMEAKFTADFTEITAGADDAHWWELAKSAAGEATATLKEGALVVDVTKAGENADDVYLKRGFENYEVAKYRVYVWADSTAATKLSLKVSEDGNDASYTGSEVEVKSGFQKLTAEVEITNTAPKVWFNLLLGGGDGRASAYTLSIEKIAIYKIIGTGADTTLFENDFPTDSADGAGQVYIRLDNPATGTASVENGAAKFSITKFGNDVWNVKTDVQLGDQAIEKGKSYRISFKITAEKDQEGQAVLENANNERAAFFADNIDLKAGVQKELSYNFTAEKDIPAGSAMLRLQVGKASAGVESNTITIDDVKLVQPGQIDKKAMDHFLLFGSESAQKENAKYPYSVFNGSDDDPSNVGAGRAYIEGGKLVYKISEGSSQGGANKISMKVANMPADSYYVVRLKIKASAAIGFDLCLHKDGGDWNERDAEHEEGGVLLRRAHFKGNQIAIGPTETVVEVRTPIIYEACDSCELILEFGSAELAALAGGVTIEISELVIGYRTLTEAV